MNCGRGDLTRPLAECGYPTAHPNAVAVRLGLSVVSDWGPAEICGLRILAALDRATVRLYERAIHSQAAECGEDASHVRLTAVAHEVLHEVAQRAGLEPEEKLVERLALTWAEAHRGRSQGRLALAMEPPQWEHWGDSPRE